MHKPHLFFIRGLLLFTILFELLAINHSLSEKRIIFVPWLLKFCHVLFFFKTWTGAHSPTVKLDNAIRFSTLSRMSVFQWHSSKWAHQFSCFFQSMSELEVLACSLNPHLNYVATMLLAPFLEPLSNVVRNFAGKMW